MKDNELEITIFDDKGNIVLHEVQEAHTASLAEMDYMVKLIAEGHSAAKASQIMLGERAIREKISLGKLIDAIKMYRQLHGCGLRESRDWCFDVRDAQQGLGG